MQQHTGQHVLSQAFVRALAAATLSFHLGDECSTIDVELVALDPQAAARVEEAANAVIFADQPVTVREYRPGELADVALRKAPQVQGDVRVVSVGSPDGVEIYDASACCGTHLRATGEVGPIHIRRWERRKGQTRIEFLCGWRALRSQRAQNAICQALAGRLTVAVADLPQVLQRLTDREQEQGKQLQELRKRLLAFEAPRLDEQAEVRGGLRVLCRLLDGYDVANMRALAQTLTQQPDRVALLAVTDPAPQICFARSQNVNLDMAALLRHASAPYGGRGGGSPQLATGGGVAAGDLAKVLAAASAQFGCTDGR